MRRTQRGMSGAWAVSQKEQRERGLYNVNIDARGRRSESEGVVGGESGAATEFGWM